MSLEQQIQECTTAVNDLKEAILLLIQNQQFVSGGTKPEPVEVKTEVKPVEVKPEPLKVAPKPEKVEKVEKVAEVKTEPKAEAVSNLTIDEVRKQLMPLVANHNPIIAETIKSLGGTTLSSLDASKYQELLDTVNAKIAG